MDLHIPLHLLTRREKCVCPPENQNMGERKSSILSKKKIGKEILSINTNHKKVSLRNAVTGILYYNESTCKVEKMTPPFFLSLFTIYKKNSFYLKKCMHTRSPSIIWVGFII